MQLEQQESQEASQSQSGIEMREPTEPAYTVEAIMKHRREGEPCPIDRRAAAYKLYIRWQGYTPSEDTWEPLENMLNDIPDMVEDYFKAQNLTVEEVMYKEESYQKLTKIRPTPAKPNSPAIIKKKLTPPPAPLEELKSPFVASSDYNNYISDDSSKKASREE